LVATSWILTILVPLLLAALVLAAAWVGVRWVGSEHKDLARAVPLFKGLSDRQLQSILRSARAVEFSPGDRIVTEGTPGNSFFLIRRGTATVSTGDEEVARLGPGSYFGELALIDEGPRTATVAAESQTMTVEIPSSAFKRALDTDPETSRHVYMKLREWLTAAGEQVPEPVEGTVDHQTLVELSRRLRELQPIEYAQPASSGWLRRFARR
jgi:CRP-like cAMP-binding protein